VQTSPAPQPSPDVAPFLHGVEALETADVQVVWRADLRADQPEHWQETVAAAPPRTREALPLPVAAVRAWLRQLEPTEVADVEGVVALPQRRAPGRPALRWRGPESEVSGPVEPDDIQPGDTLVVPAEYGGADALGWDPVSRESVVDVGDMCVNDMANGAPDDGRRRLIRLRLYDGVEQALTPPPDDGQPAKPLGKLLGELRGQLDEGADHEAALDKLLAALAARPPADPLTAAVVRQMVGQMVEGKLTVAAYPAGVVLTARVRPGFFRPADGGEVPAEADGADVDDATDADDTSSLRGGTFAPERVGLKAHCDGVARWARAFADGLGFDGDHHAVLARAAQLHDLGKADWRFQYVLYGDEPGDLLLAKSGRDLDPRQHEEVRRRAGLPKGFRHEFVSAALLRRHGQELLEDLSEEQRRLLEYLVGTHHGRGRPFVPVIEEQGSRGAVTLDWDGHHLVADAEHGLWHLGSGWPERFWGLTRSHGYWGLAYLECLLRLADGACSAEEQRRSR
jgi:CRISPR-associated endonuclease/helicase Cas3